MDELRAQITALAGLLNAANHRWLLLIGEFGRRKGWNDGALRSWASCQALGTGRGNHAVEPGHALPLPSPGSARGRHQDQAIGRRLVPVRSPGQSKLFIYKRSKTMTDAIFATLVLGAVIFFGALISVGNERQRKAIDALQIQQ